MPGVGIVEGVTEPKADTAKAGCQHGANETDWTPGEQCGVRAALVGHNAHHGFLVAVCIPEVAGGNRE